jgi:enediyne polyketide synthase
LLKKDSELSENLARFQKMGIHFKSFQNDHIYEGQRLFAAVMDLEAMAQVASATLGVETISVFEDVEFSRLVVVEETRSERLQIAALVQSDGAVDVARNLTINDR